MCVLCDNLNTDKYCSFLTEYANINFLFLSRQNRSSIMGGIRLVLLNQLKYQTVMLQIPQLFATDTTFPSKVGTPLYQLCRRRRNPPPPVYRRLSRMSQLC